MRTFTIAEFDDLPDDAFYDVVEFGRGISVEASAEQRAAMVEAHEAWTSLLDDDLREGIDWETSTRSNWDLYSELRMNGVDFVRSVPEVAAAM
jgi:hypothetical protein